MARVDYSELVEALHDGEEKKANDLLLEIIPRLVEYLEVVMGAENKEARECVQQAFLDVFEQIRNNNIEDNKYIFSYLLKASRHEYLRFSKKQHRYVFEFDTNGDTVEHAQQIENLLEEERYQILKECLDDLDSNSKEFISYFIKNPDTTTKKASKYFRLSGANVRTRKSRITQSLHECYKRKADK